MDTVQSNKITVQDMDTLIAAHDGDVALLYIYLMRGGDINDAPRVLCRTSACINEAAEKLRILGIFRAQNPTKTTKLPPADVVPEYTSDDIARRSRDDDSFKTLVDEVQMLFGRNLSTPDVRTLFGIYDYLAMPPEVIMELVSFCQDNIREKSGPGRKLSMREVEREAFIWANDEILTIEQAEERIKYVRERRQLVVKTAELLGIRGRTLSTTEQKYIQDWLNMGFSDDAIEIAFDRTLTNTGGLKWPYMNKILLSWNEKGLHTAEEINEKDTPLRKPAQTRPAKSKTETLNALRNKIKSPAGSACGKDNT